MSASKFEICSDDVMGRYLKATEDIKAGEIILCDESIIQVPIWSTGTLCLKCCQVTKVVCCVCKIIPICKKCAPHDPDECNFFRRSKLSTNFVIKHKEAIIPLRCIALYYKDEKMYDKLLRMESHMKLRKGTFAWELDEKSIIYPLLKQEEFIKNCRLNVTKELLHHFCGIFDVNAFEVRANLKYSSNIVPARSLYPEAALLAHDCQANTFITTDQDFEMRILAAVPIKKGEIITYNYTKPLLGTQARRKHLKEGKYFYCTCKRCADPTELGTHISSLVCRMCSEGLSVYCLEKKYWECNKCCSIIPNEKIQQVLSSCEAELKMTEKTLKPLENYIRKFTKILSPKHWLILEAKQCVAGILRDIHDKNSVDGTVTPKNIMLRKIELCNELLPILRVLTPGISRLTSVALYEKQISIIELAEFDFESNKLKPDELLKRLQESEMILKEAISMLVYEAKTTPEGRLTQRCLLELKELRIHINIVERIHLSNRPQPMFNLRQSAMARKLHGST